MPEQRLNANLLASQPLLLRRKFLASLSDIESAILLYHWDFWARPEQLSPPGEWETWLVLAGRGFGKTRIGAEWARAEVENGRCQRLALVGPTARDIRKTMIEGESGILAVSPPWFRPIYEPSKLLLKWPNGAEAHMYSAEEPDRLRGPNHDGAWCDEMAAWKYLEETWHNLEMTLRGGLDPRRVVTTTPKPKAVIRDLLADPATIVTRGSTYDNAANLAPAFLRRLLRKYGMTRIARQELYAELLEEAEGSLWQRAQLDGLRRFTAPDMKRVVVAIDPAVSAGEGSDETGIVVAGLGVDGRFYVLADLSGRYSPDRWARTAIDAWRDFGADRIVGEVNNGGDLIEHTLRTIEASAAYKSVYASRGKRTRAEPIAALYEQGRVHHVGVLRTLEEQMTNWQPGDARSPDRLDAAIWALTELVGGDGNAASGLLGFYADQIARQNNSTK